MTRSVLRLVSADDGNGATAPFRLGSPDRAQQNSGDLTTSYADRAGSVWCACGDYNHSTAQLDGAWTTNTADNLGDLHTFTGPDRKGQC
ncbi:hypothetical protein GCM10009730_32430 [Streptomyces albidochromogenes]|uniref:hypothetical protein n=1 Tax=Streptomyces albidochromogenes TaxID=329524 RepID=UPI00110F8680|nr:hypothetical protein [Streptomyces albidochromogenes]